MQAQLIEWNRKTYQTIHVHMYVCALNCQNYNDHVHVTYNTQSILITLYFIDEITSCAIFHGRRIARKKDRITKVISEYRHAMAVRFC